MIFYYVNMNKADEGLSSFNFWEGRREIISELHIMAHDWNSFWGLFPHNYAFFC